MPDKGSHGVWGRLATTLTVLAAVPVLTLLACMLVVAAWGGKDRSETLLQIASALAPLLTILLGIVVLVLLVRRERRRNAPASPADPVVEPRVQPPLSPKNAPPRLLGVSAASFALALLFPLVMIPVSLALFENPAPLVQAVSVASVTIVAVLRIRSKGR